MSESDFNDTKRQLIRYLSSGLGEKAVEYFKERSHSLSESARAECLGDIYFYQRDFAQAIKNYEVATKLAPGQVIVRYLFLAGVSNERASNYVDAFKYYQAAIEAEPSFVDTYIELGAMLVKVADLEGALQCYEDAIEIEPADLASHESLVSILGELYDRIPEKYADKYSASKATVEKMRHSGKSTPSNRQAAW
ncbi:TPR Domain containing protein [Pseudomonas fluorescens WH6]|nr:TPR Domain containing protein [Pseudomonas fluorescens WH6]